MAVRIEGQVFKVLEVEVKAGGGQLGGVVKTKLRNVSSGRFWEPHFRPDERLEDLELERQTMEFIYGDPDNCVFMNQNTYEQVEVPRAVVGLLEKFLEPGVRAGVEFFAGHPISIELPPVIEARVAETAPPIHSGQDNTWKFAKLENGVEIQVPLFVGPGEIVRIDIKSGRYLERVREKSAARNPSCQWSVAGCQCDVRPPSKLAINNWQLLFRTPAAGETSGHSRCAKELAGAKPSGNGCAHRRS